MAPRMFEIWTVFSSWIGPLAKRLGVEAIADCGLRIADWAAPPFFSNARMSARTMRPPGPEPWTRAGSMFFSAASLRASGEILTRSPSARAGADGAGDDGRGAASAGALVAAG